MAKNRLQRKIELIELRIEGDQKNVDAIKDVIKQNKTELKKLKSKLKKLNK